MAKQTTPTPKKVEVHIPSGTPPVIYADRILNIGFGASVSRLTLAIETGQNQFTQSNTLIIPTPILFETLEVMVKAAYENPEMRQRIIDGMDSFKEKLSELDKK